MSNTPKPLTRNQLANFLPDPRAIRAFEQSLKQVSSLTPAEITALNILISEVNTDTLSALAKSQQALDTLVRISRSLETLALAPAPRENTFLKGDYLDFLTLAPTPAAAVGRVSWNDKDGTLDLGLKGGLVTLQVGQEQLVRVVNKSSVDLVDGQVVYLSGAAGNRVAVDLAIANGSSALARTVLGLVTEPIAKNQEGFVTISGLVRNLDTSAYVDGDVLYLSATTPGAITKVRPAAPLHVVVVGFCVNANPSVGSIIVSVTPGYDLEDLSNIAISTPAAGNVLIYNATTQTWKNALLTAGSNISITNADGSITIAATGLEPAIAAGTTAQYWRGDKSWQTLNSSSVGLGNVENKTFAVGVADSTHAAASKTTPVDADELPMADSASTFSIKKLTWANLKATLKTYFDTLYGPASTVGTWTPTFGGSGGQSGQTYDIQSGTYVKVGRLVYATFDIRLTALGTITGGLQIKGLPFASSASATGSVGYFSGLATAYVNFGFAMASGVSVIDVYGLTGASTVMGAALVQANLTAATRFYAQIVYITP